MFYISLDEGLEYINSAASNILEPELKTFLHL